tara:strand:+ start:139 stop:795 length:657 start_codon:yes stop_codon:yes gene_type:complete
MVKKIQILLVTCILISGCCRENCAGTYIIHGTVSSNVDGSACVGFEIELKEQVLSGGVLNGFYETAATTTTDASGYYHIEFPRKNAISYQIEIEHEGWFPILEEIDPEQFSPDIPLDFDIITTPKADLEVVVHNAPPAFDIDKMRMRFLRSFEQYSTCDTEWRVFHGAEIDSTWFCIIPGDVWMPYLTIDQTDPENEITTIDSVYCESFSTTTITVEY